MARLDTPGVTWSVVTCPLIRRKGSIGLCALGVVTAFTMTMPSAMADPAIPTPPPAPAPDIATQAVSADPAPPPTGVPHLSSPENLPPGTTDAPVGPPESHGLAYLRDIWHAVQTQDVSMADALLLMTQRPMDPNAVPPPGLPAGPQQPLAAEPPAPTATP
jgi:hypothetical protein